MFACGHTPLDDEEYVLLVEGVVLQAVLLHLAYVFFEGTHLLFVSHDFDDIASCHYAQLRIECFYHLQVHVVHSVECEQVYMFKYDMLFNHGTKLSQKTGISISLFQFFLISAFKMLRIGLY